MNDTDFPVLPTQTAESIPIYWEPMPGSGERITVAIEVNHEGERRIFPVLRRDVLKCLYGKASKHLANHLETVLDLAGQGLGLPASLRYGKALTLRVATIEEALAASIRRFASLSSLDLVEEAAAEDAPNQEEQVKDWSEQVKTWVIDKRPDLAGYFGRKVKFFRDGEQIAFGFLSPGVCAHFGMMRPGRLASSVRDARARLYELQKAKALADMRRAGLILAVPRLGDPVAASPSQHKAIQRNLKELEMEAQSDGVAILPATSQEEGGQALLSLLD